MSAIFKILAATALVGVAPAAQASDASTSTTGSPATTQPKPDIVVKSTKKLCRDLGTTGSRARSNRLCLTKEQWAERSAATRQITDDWKGAIKSQEAGNPVIPAPD